MQLLYRKNSLQSPSDLAPSPSSTGEFIEALWSVPKRGWLKNELYHNLIWATYSLGPRWQQVDKSSMWPKQWDGAKPYQQKTLYLASNNNGEDYLSLWSRYLYMLFSTHHEPETGGQQDAVTLLACYLRCKECILSFLVTHPCCLCSHFIYFGGFSPLLCCIDFLPLLFSHHYSHPVDCM